MPDLTTQSLSQLAAMIRARQVSPVEVVEAHLRRMAELNPRLNAIVTLAPDAMDNAQHAEAAVMRGAELGPLHGVPVTVKDTIETAGLRTTSGSRVRAEYVPEIDAPAVAQLRAAGAIVIAKTNVAEMAASYDTENPVFGHANNPYDPSRTSGGSSGGEAAAIASCMSPGGIGSDLMGSIRVPAHFCGVVGLKPTPTRIACEGHIPRSLGPLWQGAAIGPIARTVEDVALLFRVLDGLELDETNSGTSTDGRAKRIAWHTFDRVCPVTDETRQAVQRVAATLAASGADVSEETPPGVEGGQELWTKLFAGTALEQMREEYAGRESEAGPLVRHLLDSDSPPQTAAELAAVWAERDRVRDVLLKWMENANLIVAPVGAAPAFPHGARKIEIGNESVSIFRAFSYAQTYNVFGLPAISIPAGQTSEGLPIGVQIIGRPFAEYEVLAAAALVERNLGGWKLPALLPSNDSGIRL
jgi:amidase